MNSKRILSQIKKDLIAHRDLEYKKGSKDFFKEPINPIGVRAKDTRAIVAKYYGEVRGLSMEDLFGVCEKLLKTGLMECGTIAFDWVYRRKREFKKNDFVIFECWLKKYVKNWAHCDDFCTHAVGALLFQFPDLLKKSKMWTKSSNRWMRRSAAVTLIYHSKQKEKKFLRDMFWVADKMLVDEDDLVQKGYGWMLKEAANFWQREVFEYVMKNREDMPRTALRYAIEKMPKGLKKKAMIK
ncbi:MAG: DNA alkylation repair protein [Patescibacteria group bacterium]|nr:DNA alkylation repair protein [Patescibacteria group bacterium]